GPDEELRIAAGEAIGTADHLASTIDDVLALARGGTPAEPVAVQELLDGAQQRWAGPLRAAGRELVLALDDPPPALASPAAVRQILDVLLDNALQHGRGTVTLIARRSSGALALDVV